ncbi:MAG: hypothetical protein ACSHXK_00550 [Oceanococcus sp.]
MQFLWILYPLLVHAAVITDSNWLQAAAISLLLLLSLSGLMRQGRLWAWLLAAVGCAFSVWFCQSGWGLYFLYLPHALINMFLALIFLHSLGQGRRAMISVVAEKIRGETLPPEIERYTRQTTWFWTALFTGMGVFGLVLAAFASHEWWSLFTNFISYALIGLVFVVEFGLRRVLFPHLQHTGLRAYVQALIKTDFRRP